VKVGIVGRRNRGSPRVHGAERSAAEAAQLPVHDDRAERAVVTVADSGWTPWRRNWGRRRWCRTPIQVPRNRGAGGPGPHRGEGTGKQVPGTNPLSPTRSLQVSGAPDPGVVAPEGRVDPLADIETIEVRDDLRRSGAGERGLERSPPERRPRAETAGRFAEEGGCGELIGRATGGEAGAGRCPAQGPARRAVALQPLTAKPVLYVANHGG